MDVLGVVAWVYKHQTYRSKGAHIMPYIDGQPLRYDARLDMWVDDVEEDDDDSGKS